MIEIIPKTEPKSIFETRAPFVIALVALFLVIGGSLACIQLQAGAKKTIGNLENFLNAGTTQNERQLEQSVLLSQKKIADFGLFLQARKDPSRFFQFLEQYTHSKVFFTDANMSISNRQVALQGQAADFTSLSQQILIFKQRDELGDVLLSNVGLGEKGRIKFSVELSFAPKIFQ